MGKADPRGEWTSSAPGGRPHAAPDLGRTSEAAGCCLPQKHRVGRPLTEAGTAAGHGRIPSTEPLAVSPCFRARLPRACPEKT